MENKSKQGKSKLGQASIFLILGVLVVAGGALYYYTTQVKETRVERAVIEVEKIPSEFNPVREFIDECVYKASIDGLKDIGDNGGYIDFTGTRTGIETSALPWTSAENRVAYWFYYDAKGTQDVNDDNFVFQRPPLEKEPNSIEAQLGEYIKKKIGICLNNFDELSRQGYSVTTGEIKPEVTVTEKDVVVRLEYPISAAKGNAKVDIDEFFVRVPINLRRIYEIAFAIAKNQSEHRYLEKYTNTLISVYSGTSPDRLPPPNELTIDYVPVFYGAEKQIEDKVKDMLGSNIQNLQVLYSGNYDAYTGDDPLTSGIRNHLETLPISGAASFGENEVNFKYLPDAFRLELNVCNGICKSSSILGFIPLVPIQRFDFSYDVVYPVMVEVRDPDAIEFGRSGYTFTILLQSVILNNVPHKSENPVVDKVTSFTTAFDSFNQPSQLRDLSLCDKYLWNSNEFTIKILNSSESTPVKDAEVYYSVSGENCPAGQTNSEGTLVSRFPTGTFGGFLTARHNEFLTKSREFDADYAASDEIRIVMNPIVEKPFTVQKRVFTKNNNVWNLKKEKESLENTEKAILTLSRNTEENEMEYSAFAEFSGSQESLPSIRLVPGKYNVQMNLLADKHVIIPRGEIKVWKPSLFNPLNKETITIPEISFGEEKPRKMHIKSLKGLAPGQYKFHVKCADQSVEEGEFEKRYRIATNVDFRVGRAAEGGLLILSRTVPDFGASENYLAVETNRETECRFISSTAGEPAETDIREYFPFETKGKLHVSTKLSSYGVSRDFEYSVRCLDNGGWTEPQKISYSTNLLPESPLSANSRTPNLFSTDEAFIAVETTGSTTCRYVNATNPADIGDVTKYKAFDGVGNINFPEGGLSMNDVSFRVSELYKDGIIVFTAIDLGVDELSPPELDDLEQLEKIEEYSKRYRNGLKPDIK